MITLSMLVKSSQREGQHNSSSEAQQDDGGRLPADPSQCKIIALVTQRWKDHQYVIGSEENKFSECLAPN